MKVFLVGGAVRDTLLDRPVCERDWVVVGATEQQMLDLGYQQVGQDFPVFLHPKTKEEYALARMERKSGKGYKGFVCHFSPEVTLEEDLKRRDLTINAIAKDLNTHKLVDPYGGQKDCHDKVLRHVSDAFREDPLRILRLARFAARFPEFSIAPETWNLARLMVEDGELNDLTPERVIAEVHKALKETASERFFAVIHDLGATSVLWPWMDDDKRIQFLLVTANHHSIPAWQKWVLLIYPYLDQFAGRYPLTNDQASIAKILRDHKDQWFDLDSWNSHRWVDFFYTIDAYRKPERLFVMMNLLNVFQPIHLKYEAVESYFQTSLDVTPMDVNPTGSLKGKAYGEELRQCRYRKVEALLRRLEENK